MSDVLKKYAERIRSIPRVVLTEKRGQWQVSCSLSDEPRVALKELRLIQKHLRTIKTEVNAEAKAIRAEYREKLEGSTYRAGVTYAVP